MSIGLKRHTKMLVAAVAVLVMTLVALLPGVAEAQSTDGALVEAAQNSNQDAAYYATASQPSPEPATRLVVVPGDSLWSISQKRLGPDATSAQIANEVEQIFEDNRGQIGDDPNLIFAGQELLLRAVAQPTATEEEPAAVAQQPATTEEEPAAVAQQPATTEEEPAAVAQQPATTEEEPATAEEEPVAATVEHLPEPNNNGERLLLGLGILMLLALCSGLVLLMIRKLLSKRRDVEGPGGQKHLLDALRKGMANEMYGSQVSHSLSHAVGAQPPGIPEQIVHAPTLAFEGKREFSRELLNKLAEELLPRELLNELVEKGSRQDLPALIHRQLVEILELVVQGKSDTEIAQQLCLSESTVKQYLRSIHKSLDVKNGTQAKASHKGGATTVTQTLQISSSPNHAEVGERATSDTAQSMKLGSKALGLIGIKCPYPVVSLGLEVGLKALGYYVHCGQKEDFAENIPSSVIYLPNGEDVVSEVERLRLVTRDAPILILGLHDDPQLARTALLTGASGFVHLGMQLEQIVHALMVASKGKLVFPSKLLDELEKELMKEKNHPQEPSALTHMLQQQPTEPRPIAPEFTSKEREWGSKINRILLVEPHCALRQALASSLDWEPDLQVVAQTGSLAEYHNIALDEIDVALVDASLPDGDDIDLVGEVSSYGVPVVAMISSSRADVCVRALKAGATKLLGKNVSFEELAEATRAAVAVSPTREGETMVDVDDRPYGELGDFLDSIVRNYHIHEPYAISAHLGKVTDYEVSSQMVESYLYGASLPEPSFFPVFAEAFSLTAEERKDLAWLYSYGYLPSSNGSRG